METGRPLEKDFGVHSLDHFLKQSQPKEQPKVVINIEGLIQSLENIYPTEPKLKDKPAQEEPRYYNHAETE